MAEEEPESTAKKDHRTGGQPTRGKPGEAEPDASIQVSPPAFGNQATDTLQREVGCDDFALETTMPAHQQQQAHDGEVGQQGVELNGMEGISQGGTGKPLGIVAMVGHRPGQLALRAKAATRRKAAEATQSLTQGHGRRQGIQGHGRGQLQHPASPDKGQGAAKDAAVNVPTGPQGSQAEDVSKTDDAPNQINPNHQQLGPQDAGHQQGDGEVGNRFRAQAIEFALPLGQP